MEVTDNTYYISVREPIGNDYSPQALARLRKMATKRLYNAINDKYGGTAVEIVVQMTQPPMSHRGIQYIVASAFVNQGE